MVVHVNSLSIAADGPRMSAGCRREWSRALICDTPWSWSSGHGSDGSEVELDGLSVFSSLKDSMVPSGTWRRIPLLYLRSVRATTNGAAGHGVLVGSQGGRSLLSGTVFCIGSTEGCGHFPFRSFLFLTSDRCRVQCYEYPSCPDVVKPKCYQACSEAPREEVAYVTCTYRETGIDQPDFLATIDLNPRSPYYCQVIHRLPVPNLKDELHCSGWSTDRSSSICFDNITTKKNKLILPGLISSRIYVVDVGTQCRAPTVCKMIEPVDVFWKCNKGHLSVVHSLPNGDILIANMGDAAGRGKGGFIVLDGETFELKGNWEHECEVPPTGYDFWYQPRHNVLISTAGMVPRIAGRGFNPDDLKKGEGTRMQALGQSSAGSWPDADKLTVWVADGERGQAERVQVHPSPGLPSPPDSLLLLLLLRGLRAPPECVESVLPYPHAVL
ncbi:uncharacterized protein LOC116238441 isoform X1 [Phasianus colchicus]|uniref:uncharacterized protein LOC116238441 isoform X1 n=1 Tax=Phasianus colchicus TaxID=9054 RepID=UPI00129E6FF8|nr:uncharacterized protein LOC116238441 isoform X1 [Phasianus colchicus]